MDLLIGVFMFTALRFFPGKIFSILFWTDQSVRRDNNFILRIRQSLCGQLSISSARTNEGVRVGEARSVAVPGHDLLLPAR